MLETKNDFPINVLGGPSSCSCHRRHGNEAEPLAKKAPLTKGRKKFETKEFEKMGGWNEEGRSLKIEKAATNSLPLIYNR